SHNPSPLRFRPAIRACSAWPWNSQSASARLPGRSAPNSAIMPETCSPSSGPPLERFTAMRIWKNSKLMGWLPLCCALLGAGVLGAIRDSHYGGDITWVGNYQAGLKLARAMHKPLLLCFHTSGCGWCQKLDAETFTDPKVVERSNHYVCVRVESDVDA